MTAKGSKPAFACTMHFSGPHNDKYGMPDPYHAYLIAGTDWEQGGLAIVVKVSGDGTGPSPAVFVSADGPEQAVAKAGEALAKLHPNLRMQTTPR